MGVMEQAGIVQHLVSLLREKRCVYEVCLNVRHVADNFQVHFSFRHQ